jgi:hypothetical protein
VTAHAFLWCGVVWPQTKSRFGGKEGGIPDFAASLQDIGLSCRTATALGIAPTDIHAFVCRNDLLPTDFRGSEHRATRSALRDLLRGLPPEGALFFVATNHGVPEGLLTSESIDELEEDDDSPLILSPRELGVMLAGWQGPQVLVIAACHAGVFLELGSEKRAVITSCAADEKYYATGMDRPCSPLLPAFFGAWTGTTFESDPAPPRERDLDAAFEAAKTRLEGGYEGRPTRTPHRSGEARWPAPAQR